MQQSFTKYIYKIVGTILLTLPIMLVSCVEDIDGVYARHRAFFRYQYVSTTPPLYAALNNPGMWCTISFPQRVYRFTLLDGTSYDHPTTALDTYTPPECISGFMVGKPNIPDFSGNFPIIAYDRVCPTCFEQAAIQRELSLSSEGKAHCTRCHCEYDLNNGGLLLRGGPGENLYRYHINYAPQQNIMLIQN